MAIKVTQDLPVRPSGAMSSPQVAQAFMPVWLLEISIHKNLLNRVYLDALSIMPPEDIRKQMSTAVARSISYQKPLVVAVPGWCSHYFAWKQAQCTLKPGPFEKERPIDKIMEVVRALVNITDSRPRTAAGRTFARLAQTAAALFRFPK